MPDVCCYCKREIVGKTNYCIPEGFPADTRHELKPLCDRCGGSPLPTLHTICEFLDKEQADSDRWQLYLASRKFERKLGEAGEMICELLVSLPSDEARLVALGEVRKKICSCGRLLPCRFHDLKSAAT
jgi:hypothetical protein